MPDKSTISKLETLLRDPRRISQNRWASGLTPMSLANSAMHSYHQKGITVPDSNLPVLVEALFRQCYPPWIFQEEWDIYSPHPEHVINKSIATMGEINKLPGADKQAVFEDAVQMISTYLDIARHNRLYESREKLVKAAMENLKFALEAEIPTSKLVDSVYTLTEGYCPGDSLSDLNNVAISIMSAASLQNRDLGDATKIIEQTSFYLGTKHKDYFAAFSQIFDTLNKTGYGVEDFAAIANAYRKAGQLRKGFKSLAEAASETLLYLSENKDKGLTIEQTQQRIREAREQFLAKYPLLLAVERLGQLDKYVERATRKGAIAAAGRYDTEAETLARQRQSLAEREATVEQKLNGLYEDRITSLQGEVDKLIIDLRAEINMPWYRRMFR